MPARFSDLENKKILVTGATRGIGRGIALALAQQKAHVVFNFREGKASLANEMALELKHQGAVEATPIGFDITQTERMREALTAFTGEYGPFEGVVNNAGIARNQLILRLREEEARLTLDTNLTGPLMLIQTLGRGLLKASKTGQVSIVNISSIVGLMGNPGQSAYAASKAGLVGLTKSLAKELGAKGIRCNAVCPGFIETDMTAELTGETRENYLSSIPVKRLGTCAEVANLVNFLLSEASSYITGEVIKIDGGLYI